MKDNRKDTTIWRNYIEKYRFLIKEYEQAKRKEHPVYKMAQDLYKAHDTCGKSFLKYDNRYKQSGSDKDLEPRKAIRAHLGSCQNFICIDLYAMSAFQKKCQ